MNNGISVLDKMKENQNHIFKLKKTADEIHLEIMKKLKEMNSYEELIISDELKLKECKEEIVGLELQASCLSHSLVTWETVLNSKKQYLEKEKQDLRTTTDDVLSNRITYCDQVNNFFMLKEDIFVKSSFYMKNSNATELQKLKIEATTLEQTLANAKVLYQEQKSNKFNEDLMNGMKMEEMKWEKHLEDRKNELKRITSNMKPKLPGSNRRMANHDYVST